MYMLFGKRMTPIIRASGKLMLDILKVMSRKVILQIDVDLFLKFSARNQLAVTCFIRSGREIKRIN